MPPDSLSYVGRTSTSALDLWSSFRKPTWTSAAVQEDRANKGMEVLRGS